VKRVLTGAVRKLEDLTYHCYTVGCRDHIPRKQDIIGNIGQHEAEDNGRDRCVDGQR